MKTPDPGLLQIALTPRQLKAVQQPREGTTGRFGFEGDWERFCTCGHPLGIHTAAAPHECLACDAHNIDPKRYPTPLEDCACVRFRPSRAKRKET